LDPVPVGEGVAGTVFARGEAVVVSDASDPRLPRAAAPDRYSSESFAVAPVQAGTRRLGVLCATERSGGAPFDETDLSLLRILAHQVGQLLEASAAAELEEDPDVTQPETPIGVGPRPEEIERDAELARRVCEAVSAEVDPARVLDGALRPIAGALDAAPVSLYLSDPERGDLACEGQVDRGRCADRARLPANKGLTGAVLATGVLVAAPDPAQDPRFDPAVDTPEGGVAAPLLCIPVTFRGKNLGVLRAFLAPGRTPSARTGEVLTAAISAAVRNVFLYRSLVDSIEEVARARREAGDA
jgi:GAF domain-containing protein